jgi:hypothetical protein
MKKTLLVLVLLSFCSGLQAQSIVDLNDDAEAYMAAGDYERAYVAFDNLSKKEPENAYYLYRKGECVFHLPARKQEAITLFQTAYDMEPNEKSILLNLGKAYHINYKFDEAIKYFKEFLDTNPEKEKKEEAEKLIENAEYGKRTVQTILEVDIRNLGPPVNTSAEEYVPVLSADETMLIYTYRGVNSMGGLMDEKLKSDPKTGVYYEDIFMSTKEKKNGSWADPVPIEALNTKGNDAPIALSPDGQTLFTFKSVLNDGGDIYISTLEGDVWSAPQKLKGDVNTKYWEGSCSITSDGKYLYFASERPGGLGKRDLYVAERMDDGSFRKVQNLGPTINTKYNDDTPFIHVDGVTFFFSSEGHNSIGDYDIFYSIKKDNSWIDPINMGYPLNTTDDDRFYLINAKGDKGYFSSNRITNGGNGTSDIFTVSPGILGEKPVLAMVLGSIYGNGNQISAQIEIIKKSNGEIIGPFTSNTKTGKYLVALSPGENYTFKVRAKDYIEQSEDLDIGKLSKFVEIRKDFRLLKNGYEDSIKPSKLNDLLAIADTLAKVSDSLKYQSNTIKTPTVTPTESVTPTETVAATPTNPCDAFKTLDFTQLKNKSLNDPAVYAKLLAIGDKICSEKMVFKVQIGAYKFPKNFKWERLKEFGSPEAVQYPDSLTRFTQGSFSNIHAAEKLRQGAINKGQTDAWIVGFIDGKRYTLEELIMVDFFNKNIARFKANLDDLKNYLSAK